MGLIVYIGSGEWMRHVASLQVQYKITFFEEERTKRRGKIVILRPKKT